MSLYAGSVQLEAVLLTELSSVEETISPVLRKTVSAGMEIGRQGLREAAEGSAGGI